MFRLASDEELTDERLGRFINQHSAIVAYRFQKLIDAYKTDYQIFHLPKKPKWKPDNRIAVNFAKYIVDTMNGFFIGIPIKITCDENSISDFVEFIDQYNDQDDNNAELSKICDIYGRGYEMYYVDENSQLCITYCNPIEAFMIYDDSVLERPRFFIRLYYDADGTLNGSVADNKKVRYFKQKGKLEWIAEDDHHFNDVPATEYIENEERQGIFEPVLSMIDEYNKAISEKANDVDYFADAYMKILGATLNEKEIQQMRDNRIINFDGDDEGSLVVDFLSKPNADTTQENLINRLEKLIFQISMVANISDENFGTSSGIALKYKLQAMSNLAKTKERKFTSGMNRRYKLLFNHPLSISRVKADDWVKLKYVFTQNYPANLLEEAQIASQMAGVTSKETQLKVLSVVDNVKEEIQRIEKETDPIGFSTDYPTNRTAEEQTDMIDDSEVAEVQGKALNGAQTQYLIAIMAQYSAKQLTEGQAINLIHTAIGISKTEAKSILHGDL